MKPAHKLAGQRWGLFLIALLATTLAGGSSRWDPVDSPVASGEISPGKSSNKAPIRGITVSCPTWGPEWGTDEMVETMTELKALGATWIAIHPYAWIGRDTGLGGLEHYDPKRPPRWLTRPIVEAHRLGLKMLIKPHLGYWGSRFRWRGEIEFQTDREWRRFFEDYETWIVNLARICRQADGFVVGTELDKTLGHEEEWRRIIRRVREVFRGPLTYGANWTDYERVPFWDALDIVGIQAYFPLVEAGAASPVTREAIDSGWRRILLRLKRYSKQTGRRIVFTELGYNQAFRAPFAPWEYQVDGPEAEAIQAACLESALNAIEREPTVVGAFLWKWFPGPGRSRDFSLETPGLQRLLRKVWKED